MCIQKVIFLLKLIKLAVSKEVAVFGSTQHYEDLTSDGCDWYDELQDIRPKQPAAAQCCSAKVTMSFHSCST